MENSKITATVLTTLLAVASVSFYLNSSDSFIDSLTNNDLIRLLQFAKASYCSDLASIRSKVIRNSQTYVTVMTSRMGTLAFTTRDFENKVQIITFRGTDNLDNWMTDLKGFGVDYPLCVDCKIHQGFKEAIDSLERPLRQIISDYDCSQFNKFVLTGHSLGGAMAVLALPIIYEICPNNRIELVTFGAPRVGNAAFQMFMNSYFPYQARVVSLNDIVPHVPPLSFGYVHSGSEIWFNDPNNIQKREICYSSNNGIENEDCSDRVFSPNYSVFDHTNYLGQNTGCSEVQLSSD